MVLGPTTPPSLFGLLMLLGPTITTLPESFHPPPQVVTLIPALPPLPPRTVITEVRYFSVPWEDPAITWYPRSHHHPPIGWPRSRQSLTAHCLHGDNIVITYLLLTYQSHTPYKPCHTYHIPTVIPTHCHYLTYLTLPYLPHTACPQCGHSLSTH